MQIVKSQNFWLSHIYKKRAESTEEREQERKPRNKHPEYVYAPTITNKFTERAFQRQQKLI